MRLTLPLSARQKAASVVTATASLETYLSGLKATQLKSLARATGIPNSGRKDELRLRIGEELSRSVFLDIVATAAGQHGSLAKRTREWGKGLSVLSIDMGIQNLAFAHLIVSPASSSGQSSSTGGGGQRKGLVTLNAWHRIGVQELSAACLVHDADSHPDKNLQSLLPPSAFRTFTTNNTQIDDTDLGGKAHGTDSKTAAINKSFEPDALSHNAFVLLYSLLQAYKPTHILIERQRFRSGGQSAVLEWSLRVGVFEGMLHAVLCTMRELARLDDRHPRSHDGAVVDVDQLEVYPISPARIMQFWDQGEPEALLRQEEKEEDDGKKAKGLNQRGVKKFKMDIVGDLLLSASTNGTSGPSRQSLTCWDVAVNTTDQEEKSVPGVRDVVDAYLRRWNPALSLSLADTKSLKTKAGRKGTTDSASKQTYKIQKMDDLADCLLQGLTWLEWQARRARIVRGDQSIT